MATAFIKLAILVAINFILINLHPVSCLIKQPEQFKPFNGIPAAFGDLNTDKRTDIVVIGGDGYNLNVYYQQQRQPVFDWKFSCKCDRKIAQVYLADIENDGQPNILPLLTSKRDGKTIYELVNIVSDFAIPIKNTVTQINENYSSHAAALNSEENPSLNSSSIVNNGSLANSSNDISEYMQLAAVNVPECKYTNIDVEMLTQPLLFDLEGDLQTDYMSVDLNGLVSVWQPPKKQDSTLNFKKLNEPRWSSIDAVFFKAPHSNSFIDVNSDAAADLVFSSKDANIMYAMANPIFNDSFSKERKNFSDRFANLVKDYEFGQSALVDINADGKIDHLIPRCKRSNHMCEIIYMAGNGHTEVIFKFNNHTNIELIVEEIKLGEDYQFPITIRAADLDGDGYTDFVVVVRSLSQGNKIVFLRNIENVSANGRPGIDSMSRTFQIIDVPFEPPKPNHQVRLVILFDINEDGKVDMLIGSSEHTNKPEDLYITAKMNSQMVDACFMKVLVTNGCSSTESNGQSASGPFICFELSQNDGKVRKGCAGQLAQSSHFALQAPYVIFGLGQTPHFVETLNVTIPGYGRSKEVRTRVFEQIVPDAQVIIIPDPMDYPNSWDYKLFLSPMSDLVLSTFITLAVICIVILFIICILHRKESLEDLAEHEEYKRHWPESR